MRVPLPHRLPLAVTAAFCLFILPINEHVAFSLPTDKKTLLLSYLLKIAFAAALYFVVDCIVTFVRKVRAGDPFYRRWLRYSGIYFAIMAVFFLLLYPGHWVHDEFLILDSVKAYNLSYTWQHVFTNIFYTFSLYIFPSAAAIVAIQATIISAIVGYICSRAAGLFKQPRFAHYLLVPFLFFPVILNNFYPLRGTLYSYTALLLIGELIFLRYRLYERINKPVALIKLTALITLVSFWRPEGMYFLVLFPLLVVWLGIFTDKSKRRQQYLLVAGCLAILLAGAAITKATSNPKYEITAMINPLSTMLQQPLKGDDMDTRLAEVNKTLNLEVVKKYPSYVETPAFWNGGVREGYEAHYDEFKKQYFYIVANNPGPFLDNRMQTFLASNTYGPHPSAGHGLLEGKPEYRHDPLVSNFLATNDHAAPIRPWLKHNVVNFLLCFTPSYSFTALGHIVWNAIIPMTLMVAAFLYTLVRRRWFWAGIIALVLLRVPLIFVTAPANYFFYYLPVYLAGYFLAMLFVLHLIDRHFPRLDPLHLYQTARNRLLKN